MYYHIKDRKWFDNRKQAKDHYGVACFRKIAILKRDYIYEQSKFHC